MSKAKQVIPKGSDYAVQSHQISRASYSMPVMHRRLIYLLMSQVRPTDNDMPEVEMSIGDIARALGLGDGGRQYEEIRAATRGALSHVLDLDTDDGWVQFQWLSRCRYIKTRDAVKLKLHDDLKPFVIELQSAFSMLSIADISQLQGRHALRLFELIMSNKGFAGKNGNKPGCWYYDAEFAHLRNLLRIAPNEYALTKNFRVRVIDGPVKEINDANLGIRVECDYDRFRKGRQLLGVRLNVKTLKKGDPRPVQPATQTELDEESLITAYPARFDYLLSEERKNGCLPFVTDPEFAYRQAALAKLQAELAQKSTKPRGVKKTTS